MEFKYNTVEEAIEAFNRGVWQADDQRQIGRAHV